MKKPNLTSEQLTTILSNKITQLYEGKLEHQLKEITYHLFDNKLMIIMEGTVTSPEKLLNCSQQQELAQEVRTVLDNVIQPQIKQLIEEVINVSVIDFLSDTTLATDRTGAIAIFELKQKTPSC